MAGPLFQLDKILLWGFTAGILGVRLAVEGDVLAVFLFDHLHFLVLVRLFSPVEESGCYCHSGHNDENDHGYNTYNGEGCNLSHI